MNFSDRKHPRLKKYDYSQNGYYHIIINTESNRELLSTVGRGLAPAKYEINLTEIGMIAEKQLLNLEKRFDYVKIDKYVIMPTHIHAIVVLSGEAVSIGTAGASPRPTLCDIVCAFKSITTRICNEMNNTPGRKIFQTSFYDEIIKNEQAYQEIWQYIEANPSRWFEKG